MKHTPGPWTNHNDEDHGSLIALEPRLESAGSAEIVAILPFGNANREANARLIAAAPDLLQLARQVVYGLGNMRENATAVLLVNQARDAIAKAEGRPS